MRPRHLIFLDELRRYSDREVCLGAAEYASGQPGWMFDPWPIELSATLVPKATDLKMAAGILTTERALKCVRRPTRLNRLPRVFCLADEAHAEADVVGVDEPAVGRMAAEHLWGRGYRSFAFIGSATYAWSRKREAGFSRWLAGKGRRPVVHALPEDALPVFWNWNLAGRTSHLQDLLAALPRPCGLMAANDVIACFVLQAARMLRRRVPDDFGVVGVDNDPFPNAAAGLAISSIDLPFREIGWRAARLLGERWRGHRPGRQVRLPPLGVVVRTSTNAFMTANPLVRKAQSYIESRRHEHLTVTEVVRAMHSNRVTLGKYFHRELGTTLLDYVRRRRLDYAAEQLRRGQHTVEDVAARCGYSSTSYFSRVIHQLIGCRPGALRPGRAPLHSTPVSHNPG